MKIRLEKLQEEDLALVAKWRMLPEVTKYMYTDPVITMDSQQKWFNDIRAKDSQRYWIIVVDDGKVGVMSLNNIDFINKRCYMGHYIADSSVRGKGLSKVLEYNMYEYVFYNLKLNKLCFEILSLNERAINLHKKLGSQVEGILKQHLYKNGVFHDVVCMGITKEKWDKIRKNYAYDKVEIEE